MNECFNCGNQGTDKYGYAVCGDCLDNMKLHSKETVRKNIEIYAEDKPHSYYEEVEQHLQKLENKYIKARIKLLDIQSTLNSFKTRQ